MSRRDKLEDQVEGGLCVSSGDGDRRGNSVSDSDCTVMHWQGLRPYRYLHNYS
jgi:hypothetical protein